MFTTITDILKSHRSRIKQMTNKQHVLLTACTSLTHKSVFSYTVNSNQKNFAF